MNLAENPSPMPNSTNRNLEYGNLTFIVDGGRAGRVANFSVDPSQYTHSMRISIMDNLPICECLNPGKHAVGLLISVRDETEARIAIDQKIDILDIKEPQRGSLGRPDVRVVNQILQSIDGHWVSIALGELVGMTRESLQRYFNGIEMNRSIRFVKMGLSKMKDQDNWQQTWKQAITCLPAHVEPVAAAYVDHETAASPAIEQVFETGHQLGCRMALVDTFDKSAGCFLDHDSIPNFIHYRQLANSLQMGFVLAGSIGIPSLAAVRDIAPQFVGIRGAVCCEQNRKSAIDKHALNRFSESLRLGTVSWRRCPSEMPKICRVDRR